MNGLLRPALRFRGTRRACTGQSQPTLCPGADISAHNALFMLFIAATTFTLTSCSRTDRFRCRCTLSAKIYPAIQTVDLGQRNLVVSTSSSPRSAARKSSSATRTIAATGFLLACFVDLKLTAFDIQTVKFSNGSCRVISRPEFDESETS